MKKTNKGLTLVLVGFISTVAFGSIVTTNAAETNKEVPTQTQNNEIVDIEKIRNEIEIAKSNLQEIKVSDDGISDNQGAKLQEGDVFRSSENYNKIKILTSKIESLLNSDSPLATEVNPMLTTLRNTLAITNVVSIPEAYPNANPVLAPQLPESQEDQFSYDGGELRLQPQAVPHAKPVLAPQLPESQEDQFSYDGGELRLQPQAVPYAKPVLAPQLPESQEDQFSYDGGELRLQPQAIPYAHPMLAPTPHETRVFERPILTPSATPSAVPNLAPYVVPFAIPQLVPQYNNPIPSNNLLTQYVPDGQLSNIEIDENYIFEGERDLPTVEGLLKGEQTYFGTGSNLRLDGRITKSIEQGFTNFLLSEIERSLEKDILFIEENSNNLSNDKEIQQFQQSINHEELPSDEQTNVNEVPTVEEFLNGDEELLTPNGYLKLDRETNKTLEQLLSEIMMGEVERELEKDVLTLEENQNRRTNTKVETNNHHLPNGDILITIPNLDQLNGVTTTSTVPLITINYPNNMDSNTNLNVDNTKSEIITRISNDTKNSDQTQSNEEQSSQDLNMTDDQTQDSNTANDNSALVDQEISASQLPKTGSGAFGVVGEALALLTASGAALFASRSRK